MGRRTVIAAVRAALPPGRSGVRWWPLGAVVALLLVARVLDRRVATLTDLETPDEHGDEPRFWSLGRRIALGVLVLSLATGVAGLVAGRTGTWAQAEGTHDAADVGRATEHQAVGSPEPSRADGSSAAEAAPVPQGWDPLATSSLDVAALLTPQPTSAERLLDAVAPAGTKSALPATVRASRGAKVRAAGATSSTTTTTTHAPPTTTTEAPATATTPPAPAPVIRAFDTCETPTIAEMAAWKAASPYQGIGIYVGGGARARANRTLDGPGWVTAVIAEGWKLLPIYVGPQAPCSDFKVVMSEAVATAAGEGSNAAEDAANHAAIAGLPTGSPIYADIESYHGDGACDETVRAFLAGWTSRLHERGYKAALYGNYNSAILAAAGAAWRGQLTVDGIWIAWWSGTPQLGGYIGIEDTMWSHQQRVHQYRGGHNETWGGVTIEVDSNLVDGLVAP